MLQLTSTIKRLAQKGAVVIARLFAITFTAVLAARPGQI